MVFLKKKKLFLWQRFTKIVTYHNSTLCIVDFKLRDANSIKIRHISSVLEKQSFHMYINDVRASLLAGHET